MSPAFASRVPALALDPFSAEFLSSPYDFHAMMRDAGPVFWLEVLGVYGMARHAEVSAVLKDNATYCSGRGVGLSDFAVEEPWRPPSLLLESDAPLHDRTRGVMNRVVSLNAVKALRETWLEKAERLADNLVGRGRIDAIADIAEVYPLLVFPDTLGLMVDGREHILPYAAVTFNAFGPRNMLFVESERRARDAIAWVAAACRRENLLPGGWGMQIYKAADRGECTSDEAERLVRSLISAGVDTTVNGIGNLLHALALHPEQWQTLRNDRTLIKRAFEEALRWDSTVQTFFRTTTRQVEIGGEVIAEGSKVLLFLAAANRDERRWRDADLFDISRNASGHVGFGFGIHQCLGQMVARLEAEAILEALIPRVSEIRLAGQPARRLNNTLHALASLPIDLIAV